MLRVLIFDSGVGGLSISKSLKQQLPQVEQLLLSDTACFPYGEMEQSLLVERVTALLVEADERFKPDCIVVACNTVSTIALEKVRTALTIPVVGVVPAIKPAASMSHTKVIGLLATPATIRRSYTAELVNNFADDCTLVSVGSTRLVEIAEERLSGKAVDLSELREILTPILDAEKQQGLDTLVLGCTHFPLLSDLLQQVLSKRIRLVDSSSAIARQVETVMTDKLLQYQSSATEEKQDTEPGQFACYMTKLLENKGIDKGLRSFGFSSPKQF